MTAIRLSNIHDRIWKTSDPSELYSLVKKLREIETQSNIDYFQKVIAELESSLIHHNKDRGQINVTKSCESKDTGDELGKEAFDKPSGTNGVGQSSDQSKNKRDMKNMGCHYGMTDKSDEICDEESIKQWMSNEFLADPILEALNTFLDRLRKLTSSEVEDVNNKSLAESFRHAYSSFLDDLKNLTSDEGALEQIHDMQREIKENLPNRSDFTLGIDSVLLLLVPKLQDSHATINACKPERSVSIKYVPASDEQVKNGFCCRIIQLALAIFMLFFLSLILFISIFLRDDTVTGVQIF